MAALMSRARRNAAVAMSAVVVIALSACSGANDDPFAPVEPTVSDTGSGADLSGTTTPPGNHSSWVEPAWMTADRERDERHQLHMYNCLTEAGYDVTPKPAGGFRYLDPGDPNRSEEEKQEDSWAMTVVTGECVKADPEYPPEGSYLLTRELAEQQYEHLLDTIACLRAEGYETSPAPDRSAWIEQLLDEEADLVWVPFMDIQDDLNSGKITMTAEEAVNLQLKCRQDTVVWKLTVIDG